MASRAFPVVDGFDSGRDGAYAGESEVDVLAAAFVRAFYGNDVGVVGSQGVHCFLAERDVFARI